MSRQAEDARPFQCSAEGAALQREAAFASTKAPAALAAVSPLAQLLVSRARRSALTRAGALFSAEGGHKKRQAPLSDRFPPPLDWRATATAY